MKFVSALLLFCSVMAYGQNDNVNPDSQLKYVDIIPPSPAVAKIADYSRPDVGLNTGTAQFSLPITSLEIGSIKIPITLNYSSNGVKVDAISSRVGVDFQLEAGGAITRTAKGRADEWATMLNPPLNQGVTSRAFIAFLELLTQGGTGVGGYDAEPDMFSFSFCGNGGKFFMDSAQNIYQIPKTNNKIVHNFSGTDWNFKISDANGNDYYFGGTGYVEASKQSQSCSHPALTATVTTAWFLQKIVLYNGDIVNFNYGHTAYSYDMSVSETMFYQQLAQSQYGAQGCNAPALNLPANDCLCPVNNNSRCVSYVTVDTYYLKSITTSRSETISLGYQSRTDCGDSLLTSVSKSFNGSVTESYKLNYTIYNANANNSLLSLMPGTNTSDRYFLSSVTQLFSGNYINRYVLSYNDPGALPARLSFAQDHWGYYNGMSTNSTLIPKPGTLDLIAQFPQATANREVDTVLCKKGLLTKIQYVTGGYDSITYQSNTSYMTKTVNPTTYTNINGTDNGGDGFAVSDTPFIGTFQVQFKQTVSIVLMGKDTSHTMGADFHYGSNYTLSGPVTDSEGVATGVDSDGDGVTEPGTTGVYFRQIELTPGWYTLTLTATGHLTAATIKLTYVPGAPTNVTKNWYTGGARVGQIVTKSYNGTLIGKKKYKYSTANSTHSSGVINYDINYVRPYGFNKYWWDSAPDADGQYPNGALEFYRPCSYTSMFSTSLGTLFNPSGNSVSYSFVSETFDDAGGSGLVEHTFMIVQDQAPGRLLGDNPLNGRPTSSSVKNNGKEIMTSNYKKTGSSFQLVNRSSNYYSFGQGLYDEFVGVTANRLSPNVSVGTGPPQGDELDVLEASDYHIFSPWNTLDSAKMEEFGPDGSVYTTMTKYGYDASVLLPSQIIHIDSYGSTNTTNNYYSGMSTIPGTNSSQDSLLASMKIKNAIGQLVYQQKTVAGTPVSAHRVLVGRETSSSPILPNQVLEMSTTLGSEENLFTITKYDSYGNIRERRGRDSIAHSFVWDYNGKYPVSETVGAGYLDADATSFEGTSYSATDSWNVSQAKISSNNAFTGRRSFNLLGQTAITRGNLTSSRTYVISFWSIYANGITVNGATATTGKVRNGWTYNEITVSGVTSVSISGMSGYIDELRICPKGALMTTYTYDPEVGMTSTTDANNVSTYYEYDGLKRLITVRDDQKKILKTNTYRYYDPSQLPPAE